MSGLVTSKEIRVCSRYEESCHVWWFSRDFDSFCGSTGFAYSVFIPWPRDFGRNWLSFDCIEIQCVSKFWWFWLLIWILCLNEFCLQCIYMDFERNKCLNIYLRFSRIFYLFVSILYYLWCCYILGVWRILKRGRLVSRDQFYENFY